MRHAYGALNRVNDLQAFYGRHFAQVPRPKRTRHRETATDTTPALQPNCSASRVRNDRLTACVRIDRSTIRKYRPDTRTTLNRPAARSAKTGHDLNSAGCASISICCLPTSARKSFAGALVSMKYPGAKRSFRSAAKSASNDPGILDRAPRTVSRADAAVCKRLEAMLRLKMNILLVRIVHQRR